MRKCRICKEDKKLEDFVKAGNCKEGRTHYCKDCHNARVKIKRNGGEYKKTPKKWSNTGEGKAVKKATNKDIVNKMKLDRGCDHCGFKCAFPEVYDWHHERDKTISVGRAISQGYGIEMILEEIDKCICVCSNCHRIIHAKLRE